MLTTRKQILIIDDEENIRELLKFNLEREGFLISWAKSGEEGIEKVLKNPPHVVILDLMLPGMSGLEVCKVLRNNDKISNVAIIMLTGKSEESDIIVGLELGADDYITKPFSPNVLLAKLRAVLRRQGDKNKQTKKIIQIRELSMDTLKHEVKVNGKKIDLTTTEFGILEFMARNPSRVFTRDQILNNAWGKNTYIIDRAVDVHIRGLRKKLGKASYLIETIRGIGYRFKEA